MDEARTWDRMANRYEKVVGIFGRSYPAIRAGICRDLRGRSRVLEIASGTGQFTASLAAVARSVVATDISTEMTARLRETVADLKMENVEVREMSAYEIDAADGSFDGVLCANALHVMEEPRRALAELHRVLEDGGTLIVPTFLHGAGAARRSLSVFMGLVSPFVAHGRFDLPGLRRLVEGAGFTIDRCEQLPGVFPTGYVVATRSNEGGIVPTASDARIG